MYWSPLKSTEGGVKMYWSPLNVTEGGVQMYGSPLKLLKEVLKCTEIL